MITIVPAVRGVQLSVRARGMLRTAREASKGRAADCAADIAEGGVRNQGAAQVAYSVNRRLGQYAEHAAFRYDMGGLAAGVAGVAGAVPEWPGPPDEPEYTKRKKPPSLRMRPLQPWPARP